MAPIHTIPFDAINSTAPYEQVHGWVSEPSGRGTASLLRSCIFVIFLCSWSALHVNIPSRRWSPSKRIFYKLLWTLVTILTPEFVFMLAIIESFSTRVLMRWSRDWPESFSQESPHTKTHAWFTVMGGFEVECADGTHRINFKEFDELVTRGSIPKFPITEVDLADKSKSDWLGKSITCLQVLWLVVQLIGRRLHHLSTTPLEVFTLGITICSLCTYATFWYKPQGIEQPVLISTDKTLRRFFGRNVSPRSYVSLTESGDGKAVRHMEANVMLILAVIVVFLFKACHFIAWNFYFPTITERLLWRTSSIISAVLSVVLLFVPTIVGESRMNTPCWDSALFMILLIYPFIRVFLIVECFTSLRSVPAGVYQTVDWSLYIPHL